MFEHSIHGRVAWPVPSSFPHRPEDFILKIPDNIAKSGIKARHLKSMSLEEVRAEVMKFHKRKPRLLCRSSRPGRAVGDILHIVELCFDAPKRAVDCSSEG